PFSDAILPSSTSAVPAIARSLTKSLSPMPGLARSASPAVPTAAESAVVAAVVSLLLPLQPTATTAASARGRKPRRRILHLPPVNVGQTEPGLTSNQWKGSDQKHASDPVLEIDAIGLT